MIDNNSKQRPQIRVFSADILTKDLTVSPEKKLTLPNLPYYFFNKFYFIR